MPVIGFMSSLTPSDQPHVMAAFHRGLKELGYFEGRNMAIEYGWAEGRYERLPALAADLVRRQVAAIAAIRARVGRMREPRADLEQQLGQYRRELGEAREHLAEALVQHAFF